MKLRQVFDFKIVEGEWKGYGWARNIRIGGDEFEISAGGGDTVRVYRTKGLVVVVSFNRRLDYCGIEVFETGNCIVTRFYQGDETRAALGPRGVDYEDRTIASRLFDIALEVV